MTAQGKIKDGEKVLTGLDLLRAPFPPHQISKLPKPTKAQTDAVRADFKAGIRCKICGAWHHPQVVHLDYVGHAALTDRLLDCDPSWNWEPVATTEHGTPLLDENGGMWIKLTVCGVTRLGYGHPDGKKGGDAIKELIGDALRNAAMRFGAALDLWHKGELHAPEVDDDAQGATPRSDNPAPRQEQRPAQNEVPTPRQMADRLLADIHRSKGDKLALTELWNKTKDFRASLPDDMRDEVKAKFAAVAPKDPAPANADLGGDQIPY